MESSYISRQDWCDYRTELMRIIRHTEKRNKHQFAEQIDEALSNDRAFLFLSDDGFLVLRPIVDDNENIHVEVMFAFSWSDDAINEYQPIVEQMTSMINGKSIILYTVVKKLGILLQNNGYTLEDIDENGVMRWTKQLP